MRHSAITFAEEVTKRSANGEAWDIVFCTDMLNLAEFWGLCPPAVRDLPSVAYFHENQLTYPQTTPTERDLHFAFTNFTTAIAATEVWFNSWFHSDEFLNALGEWLPRMPDFAPLSALDQINQKTRVASPGISMVASPILRSASQPLTILWVSRWEHDKNPELFFAGLEEFAQRGIPFRLNVLGESYSEVPPCFEAAKTRFADHILHWGFLPSRAEYEAVLKTSDVVVSTADHEFFGIAILEATARGCFPLVPKRLAYPEVLGDDAPIFHEDTAESLSHRLSEISQWKTVGDLEPLTTPLTNHVRTHYSWEVVQPGLDDRLRNVAHPAAKCGQGTENRSPKKETADGRKAEKNDP